MRALLSSEAGSGQSGEGSVVVPEALMRGRREATDPACLALVLNGLLGVRHGSLHIVHRMFHVVLDPVNHLSLQGQDTRAPAGPPSGQDFGEAP